MTLLAGLTGGLACGKSTVLHVFAERGARTVSADRLARQVLDREAVQEQVAALLGPGVRREGRVLDRQAVARRIFADDVARRAVEGLMLPLIARLEEEETSRLAAAGARVVVYEAPLLLEAGRRGRYHRLVVAHCPEPLQLERAVARGLDAEDARRRIAAQLPVGVKARAADYLIDTAGTIAETRRQAVAVWELLEDDARVLAAGHELPPRRRP